MVRRRDDPRSAPDRSALARERAALLARLAEIDAELAPQGRESAVLTPPEHR